MALCHNRFCKCSHFNYVPESTKTCLLGELPDNLQDVKENKGSMALSMVLLSCLCVLMGLLVLAEPLRQSVLAPAVKVLIDGLAYSANIIGM